MKHYSFKYVQKLKIHCCWIVLPNNIVPILNFQFLYFTINSPKLITSFIWFDFILLFFCFFVYFFSSLNNSITRCSTTNSSHNTLSYNTYKPKYKPVLIMDGRESRIFQHQPSKFNKDNMTSLSDIQCRFVPVLTLFRNMMFICLMKLST